ncbi:MAG: lytic murein transglycosylase B [Cellvibrionaceae bacterium]|nr:lytic murein transglycosylase B [Cellvibrionaceae bacterium]MCV6628043.1 lytic murein transglycosylase B [Cellvibrionaceae bacterium]
MIKKIMATIGLGMVVAAAPIWAAGYESHPGAKKIIDKLVAEKGFERQALEQLFAKAEKKQSILDAISRPAEKTKEWHEYRNIFLKEKRMRQGVEFWQKHKDTLDKVSSETGVPAEIIVAIIGVETYYGRITGSYRVLDALSTLAFDYPRRSKFFTKELEHFILLTKEQGQDPLQLKGSYAGAMGYGQFMPSSFRAYAKDYDGDKVADIWNNPNDAIASVANYFVRHGWRHGELVVQRASLEPKFNDKMANDSLKPKHTIASLGKAGFKPSQDSAADAVANLVKLEGAKGTEYWLGMHNFYVITRYNHSRMYAMAVYQLAQEIRQRYQKRSA